MKASIQYHQKAQTSKSSIKILNQLINMHVVRIRIKLMKLMRDTRNKTVVKRQLKLQLLQNTKRNCLIASIKDCLELIKFYYMMKIWLLKRILMDTIMRTYFKIIITMTIEVVCLKIAQDLKETESIERRQVLMKTYQNRNLQETCQGIRE